MTYTLNIKVIGKAALALKDLAAFHRRQMEYEHGPLITVKNTVSDMVESLIFSALYDKANKSGSILQLIDFAEDLSGNIEVEEASV